MRRLSIIVPKEQLHNLLVYTGQEQILHLISVPHKALPEGVERYDASNVLGRSSAIRNRILSLNSALGTVELSPERIDAPIQDLEALADFLDKETAKLEHSFKDAEESADKLQTERERAQELARFLSGLESAGVPLDAIGGKGFLTILAGEVDRESVQGVQKALEEVTYGNAVFAITGTSDKTQTFLAVFPTPFQEEARQSITALGAKLEASLADLPADASEARKMVDAGLEQIERSAKRVEHEREDRVKELGPRTKGLSLLSEVLEIRARALAGSSTTQATCMLQPWVPKDRVQQLEEGASKSCSGLASIHIENEIVDKPGHGHEAKSDAHSATEESSPPSLVRVPSWASPLQSVINNFGVPSYNETNPLIFMLVSYPVIYGLMFGDFGEGVIFIAFGLFLWTLKRKQAKVSDFFRPFVNGAELIILLGIGITVFGFVFGDFFGFESSHVFGFHGLFSPTEGALDNPPDITHLQTFMVIVLLFGVAHYTFGLSLSAYNKLHRKEYSEAFFGPICWAWFYLVGVYIVAGLALANFDFSVALKEPALLVLVVVPLMLMVWKEGGLHAFEAFLSAASNTFSYLRIWALNIADFFFKFALFTSGGIVGGDVGAIVGAVLGNVLVMIIEGLIVFVQTLRLHWVEWFSKFYEGAGLSFAPYQEPKGWNVRVRG